MFKMWAMTESSIIEGSAMIYMGICAVFDIRHREIPLLWNLTGIAAAAGLEIWRIAEGLSTVAETGLSLLPGVSFLLTGFATGEKIGYGDGLILIAAGLFLGIYPCFLALCTGLIVSAAAALILLLFRRAGRNSRIPFAPFLLIGMGVVLFA